MAGLEFRFKQFGVIQEHTAMRVNTDAVLLGAWMEIPMQNNISMLDIGTGTGVIALMAAQRVSNKLSGVKIDAVEIDKDACKDAELNFSNAHWDGLRPNLYNTSIQDFTEWEPQKKYDLIFSNPPYFIDSLKNPNQAKSVARHSDTLSQGDLLLCVGKLLKPGGKFAVVLPKTEGDELLRKIDFLFNNAIGKQICVLSAKRVCKVKTTERKEPKRYLMEFEYNVATERENTIEETLVMLNNGAYTSEYRELAKDFYLYF